MIPLELELCNFMPYRGTTSLDFRGIHVACLSGDNGAGKSALLDAITWVLWGKARARRDDELIHQGREEMSVCLTFELEDNVYRVLRTRKAGARGQSRLDLQVQTPKGTYHTLAEPTMRETQAKIDQLLHLDYDTFINSAFLLQNRADEFTVKTPGQRKQVLADILGLSRWEAYEGQAKQHLKAIEEQLLLVDARLREIDEETARRPEYEAELRQARQAALEMADALRQAEEAQHRLQQATHELRSVEAQAADLETRLAHTQSELERIASEREEAQARLEQFRQALDDREHIEAGYVALQETRTANGAMNARLGQLVQLNQRKSELEATIADARRRLETEERLAAQAVADLEARLADLVLADELKQLQTQVQATQARADEAEIVQEQLAALVQDMANCQAQNAAIKRDMDALAERINAIQSVEAICPTCDRALDDEERTRLLDEWQSQREAMGDTWRANEAIIEQAAERQKELEAAIAQAQAEARQLPALHKQVAEPEARYRAAQEAASAVEDKQAYHAILRQRLEAEDYAHNEQAELMSLCDELAGRGYDVDEHQRIKDGIARLAVFEGRKAQLEAAAAGLADTQARLVALDEARTRWEATLEADRQRQAELEDQASTLREQLTGAERVRDQVDSARAQERHARERVGAAQQRLAACDALSEQKKTRLAERDRLAGDKSLYEELRTAFGKRGVPALIIEAAIPEVEDRANELLARITAGRMHVRFDTQRETLKGETVETLDIKIADELGTREYAMLSGGESFRVNFAIRLALSRLLAHRAGAQLQTLVIDEGFGSLDASGRERLVEAITAIQGDFARILVVTHIDELRDVFPTRIGVEKTAEGSRVSID